MLAQHARMMDAKPIGEELYYLPATPDIASGRVPALLFLLPDHIPYKHDHIE